MDLYNVLRILEFQFLRIMLFPVMKRIKKLATGRVLKLNRNDVYLINAYHVIGQMTRKSLNVSKGRLNLLGIIHTDVCDPLRHVSRQVENQLGKTIKALRSDRGGEYISQEFKDYLKDNGIVQQLTPPYTPQHNGVSESRNRTLLDMVRSMMNFTTLPLSIWDYALESATRILNMVPTKKFDKTSYELWYGKVPNLSYLKVEDVEALRRENTPDKLRDKIYEDNHLLKSLAKLYGVEGFETLEEVIRFVSAMLDAESNKCIACLNADYNPMMDNNVWFMVDLPPGCKTVGSKWIFKKKTDMDGIVHVYKARLVAKGYTQLYGVDYEETFSPVANIKAIRIHILSSFYDYEIWQMDVKTTFLNGYLDEDIYMVQPKGFVDPNHPRKVCKLKRSIYGLKQALRSWNKRFDEEIKRFGLAQNLDKPCVYQKASGSNVMIWGKAAFILGNQKSIEIDSKRIN
ncbi:retrotransposon protein, putative, ty1-copia subclass [Tanacetum coccineum]